MKKSSLAILFFIIINNIALSQSIEIENIKSITTNPNSWVFGDYSSEGNVDKATGKFNFEIPLGSIDINNYSLPIKLQYSTSGVKVNDEASEIGLGWNLMAGGQVTRIPNGNPDDVRVIPLDHGLFTGVGVPTNSPHIDHTFTWRKPINTKHFSGSATNGYYDYYSKNFPIPRKTYGNIDLNDYTISSILHMQTVRYNYESQRDIFHVAIGDLNFHFMLNLKKEYHDPDKILSIEGLDKFEAIVLDNSEIKVEFINGNNGYYKYWQSKPVSRSLPVNFISSFIVTDNRGIKYYFDQYTFDDSQYIASIYDHSKDALDNYRTIQLIMQDSQVNNWSISKIEFPNKETIEFKYKKSAITQKYPVSRTHYGEYTNKEYNLKPQKLPYGIDYLISEKEKLYLSEIKTNFQKILFVNSFDDVDRKDLDGAGYLSSIIFLNSFGKKISNFELNQISVGKSDNYRDPSRYRFYLVGLKQRSEYNEGTYKEFTHNFDYNNTEKLPNKNAMGQEDLYGYFLNKAQDNPFPYFPNLYIDVGSEDGNKIEYYPRKMISSTINGVDRIPNPNSVYYGTLSKVTFPSKGTLEVNYEINQFFNPSSSQNNVNGPGVRVNKLIYKDFDNSIKKIKQYEYKNFNNTSQSSGVLIHKPSFAYISNYAFDNNLDRKINQTKQFNENELFVKEYYINTITKEELNRRGVNNPETILKKMINFSTTPMGPQQDIFGREIIYTNVLEKDILPTEESNGYIKYYNYYDDNRPEVNVVSGPTDDFTYLTPGSKNVFKANPDLTRPWCCNGYYNNSISDYIKVGYGYVEKKGKDIYPFPSRSSFSSFNARKIGKLEKEEHYSSSGEKLIEKNYNYKLISKNSDINRNFKLGYLDTHYYEAKDPLKNRFEYLDNSFNPKLKNNAGLYFFSIDSLVSNQKIVVDNVKTTEFFNNNKLESEIIYDYSSSNHSQLTKQTITNSKGEYIISEYQYPSDLTYGYEQSPTMQEMVNRNIIATPIITKTKNGSTVLSELRNFYKYFPGISGDIILPEVVYQKKGAMGEIVNTIDRKITYNSYDTQGNLTQYTLENGIPISIIWGYRGQYPIAKIEGASLSEVSSFIQNLEIASNNGTLTKDSFTNLRTALPQAMISSYIYQPLVGVTQIIQPNGISEFYKYDEFGRLMEIKNDKGETLKTFEYHYKN
ncbi:hypothetical protein [Empedobacter tilapiae]|uniref:RHS repeat protein n=1 Tax=Empedobacter tilapiae TaxID=2491114 RepID=A0A4Z1BDI9_9FLAO|nr:hypothetical protein [Empedobacter tilapiae]TGN30009.1 hypothetical protein E4J94_00060 [Empedobacter tilapiae]